MHIEFLGATREVTGSCHLLHVRDSTVMLDCGMFQGRRADATRKNQETSFDLKPLRAVVLSHAHIDHSGRLPLLARLGIDRPVFATPATRDLCAIMLADSAHIQQKDAEFLARRNRSFVAPLYDNHDVERLMARMTAVPLETPFDVAPGVRATFKEAGHILGSASVLLECEEDGVTRRLVYSGDVGRRGLPIIRDPEPPVGADVVVMESTYGDREHSSPATTMDELGRVVRETAERGGRVLIPAFAVGRAQEILYDLHRLKKAGAIPPIPVILDSPLAIAATSIFSMHPEAFDRTEELVASTEDLFDFELLEFARDAAASKALNARHGPMIIIAASGMAEAGRILHHLAHGASDPRNTILIVGFQAEHTLGRRIQEQGPVIKVYGEEVPLRAHVEVLSGYSAHADRHELVDWLERVRGGGPAPRVHLVHGEQPAQDTLAAELRRRGYDVNIPERGSIASL